MDLWPLWDGVRCPVLLLRGTESDVLAADTAHEMVKRKPTTRLVELDGGHHLHLESPEPVAEAINAFRRETAPS